jgi:MFS family permease
MIIAESCVPSAKMWQGRCGCFEFYDLFLTAYLSPALESAGIFRKGAAGLFGLSDQAAFASVTFAGLFLGTIAFAQVADKFGRRASFGLLFAALRAPAAVIALGVLITLSNNLLSYAYHAYQAELFPTRIRARAVGFVYSWSRLSTVFTSLMIGFFLDRFGPPGVFGFIAASMAVVCVSIGVFGPKTRARGNRVA